MTLAKLVSEIEKAEIRIRPHVRETYVHFSDVLRDLSGAWVQCKLENLQFTGSFKVRGAISKILALPDKIRRRGVVAASTGNHGAAVAYCLRQFGTPGEIFVPEGSSPGKIEAMQRYAVKIRFHGQDCAETEAFARRYAEEHGMAYISPYNDVKVIAGQGTIGVELARQLGEMDAVFVSVGGGGLISGIGAYLRAVSPRTRIIGCSPENSAVMMRSLEAGKILDLPSQPTLSDGTAGGLEPGAMTFDLCRQLVDDFVTVTEEEIAHSLRLFIKSHHMLIEGAAAVAIAAFLKQAEKHRGKNVVLVLCGANIGFDTLKKILD